MANVQIVQGGAAVTLALSSNPGHCPVAAAPRIEYFDPAGNVFASDDPTNNAGTGRVYPYSGHDALSVPNYSNLPSVTITALAALPVGTGYEVRMSLSNLTTVNSAQQQSGSTGTNTIGNTNDANCVSVYFDIVSSIVLPPPTPTYTQPTETPTGGYDVFIRAGDTLGLRALPRTAPGASTWNIERRGGYNDLALTLNAKPTDLPAIISGDRVEVWHGARRQYRGWIRERTPATDGTDKITIKAYGRVFDMAKRFCDRLIVTPSGADIVTLFGQVATAYVTGLYPAGSVALELPPPSGFTVTKLDTRGQSLQQVFDSLCDATGYTYVWGWDVAPDRRDRMYLRASGESRDGSPGQVVFPVPGDGIGAATAQVNTADIVNRLRLTGGALAYPNLLKNGSFEEAVPAGESAGNLLQNGSFEIGSSHGGATASWSYLPNPGGVPGWNGACAIHRGEPSGENPPFDGDWSVETDHRGEGFYQVVAGIVPGARYRCVWYANPEPYLIDGTGSGGVVSAFWFDGAGNALGTVAPIEIMGGLPNVPTEAMINTSSNQIGFFCLHSAYDRFSAAWIAPAGAASCRVQFEADATAAPLLWDKVSFFDADVAAQDGWGTSTNAPGSVVTATVATDWVYTGAAGAALKPVDGAYAVHCVPVGATDADNGDALLSWLAPIPVEPGAQYMLSGFYAGTGKLIPELQFYANDGKTAVGSPIRSALVEPDGATPGATWRAFLLRATAPQPGVVSVATAPQAAGGAQSVKVSLRMRAAGDYYFDALCLQDARGNPTGQVPGRAIPFVSGDKLSLFFRAEDVVSAAANAAVNGSFAANGWREARESDDAITDGATAQAFARAYFLARAAPVKQITTMLHGAARDVWVSDLQRLAGDDGAVIAPEQQPVARIKGAVDAAGSLARTAEAGKEQPTLFALMRQAAKTIAAGG